MDYEGKVYVENLNDRSKPYKLEYFFGKESQKMYEACKKVMNFWLYPNQWYVGSEEMTDPEEAKKAWEAEKKRAFNTVYGIARRHGCYMKWLGDGNPSLGDQWFIHHRYEKKANLHITM